MRIKEGEGKREGSDFSVLSPVPVLSPHPPTPTPSRTGDGVGRDVLSTVGTKTRRGRRACRRPPSPDERHTDSPDRSCQTKPR